MRAAVVSMLRPLFVLIALAAGTAAVTAYADPARAPDVELEHVEANCSVDAPVLTPHTQWARPYARGRIRVLFLTGIYKRRLNIGITRAPVELVARFDIAADAVTLEPTDADAYAVTEPGASAVYGGAVGEERLAGLLEKPYDCYVCVAPDTLGHIPHTARAVIMEHVRAGAGLVFMYRIDEKDGPALAGARELERLPAMLAGADARAFALGEGRIVSHVPRHNWNLWESTPELRIFGPDLLHDLNFESRGRAVLWAAGREPQLDLSVSLPVEAIRHDDPARVTIGVKWKGTKLNTPLQMDARIRGRRHVNRSLPSRGNLDPSGGRVSFAMPQLAAGKYWIDVKAASQRGVEAWAVRQFVVTTDRKPLEVSLARQWGEAGEPIKGSVALDAPGRAGLTLQVEAIDRYGRVLARHVVPDPPESIVFSLPTGPGMPNSLGIQAILAAGDVQVSYGFAVDLYTIPHRRHGEFNFVMWGRLYSGAYAHIAQESLAAGGVTSRMETSRVPWWFMSRTGMNFTAFCHGRGLQRQRWGKSGRKPSIVLDENGVLSEGCWNDEPAATQRLRDVLQEQNHYRERGIFAYSMGDENETLGSCLHAACMTAYRRYLQKQYGGVDALNASWGTTYARFDEVALTNPGDNDENEARAQKNYPRWFDRKAFQSWNFGNFCRRFREAAKQVDPHAVTGLDGTGWIDDDLDQLVRYTDWLGLYSIPAAEVVRSIAPRGFALGMALGYSDSNPKYALSDFWLSVLRGANFIIWWRVDIFLGPHLGPSVLGSEQMVNTGRVIFDGLGTLLNVKSRMQHDGIVMLHSFASAQAASHLEAGPTYGTYSGWMTSSESRNLQGIDWALKPKGKNHLAWHRAIRAVGLQFEYVTDRMMRRDEFTSDQYRVLILSQCEAIGPTEAQLIRRFAAEGGTVIADVRPGIYDGHLKPLDGSVLDDLFGVRHTANAAAVEAAGSIRGAIGGKPVALDLPNLHVNPAVQVTSGKALGKAGPTPICIVNQAGKGRAILLNFPMCTFSNLSLPETPEADAQFLQAVFAAAGVRWPLHLKDDQGRRKRNLEAVRWRTGENMEVVAVYGPLHDGREQWLPAEGLLDRIHALDVPEPVLIELPEAHHVTQIGSPRRIGLTRRFTVQTRPWRPVLLVLSEGELNAPVMTPVRAVAAPGEKFELTMQIPGAQGMHAFKLRATNPDGQAAPWFDQSVIVEDGLARIVLPIAYNEQPGAWTVIATDLYTGQEAIARIWVE